MQSTERNTLLIALFVVVFAVVFVLEAWQGVMNSGQASPLSTSSVLGLESCRVLASCGSTPRINLNETNGYMRSL